jgi:hypothetical protein
MLVSYILIYEYYMMFQMYLYYIIIYIYIHYNYIWNPPFLSPTLKPVLATETDETEASGKGGLGGSTRGAGTQ